MGQLVCDDHELYPLERSSIGEERLSCLRWQVKL